MESWNGLSRRVCLSTVSRCRGGGWIYDRLVQRSILSLPQRVQLNIQGQNDPPTGIRLPHRLEIRENEPGAVVGPVEVDDVDVSAVYSWTVDDTRFEISNGLLKLRDVYRFSLAQASAISLLVRAKEVTSGNTIEVAANLRLIPIRKWRILCCKPIHSARASGRSIVRLCLCASALPPDQYAISVSDSRFEVVNGLFKLRDSVALDWESSDALPVTLVAQATNGEQYSKQTLVRVIQERAPTVDPNDVDGDGFLTPIDVLI